MRGAEDSASPDYAAVPSHRLQRTTWRARQFWHFLVWLLIWTSGWDALGLLTGGDVFFAGPSYDVLRALASKFGGMRAYGVPLGVVCLVLTMATVWSYGRLSGGRDPSRVFPVCLSLLATWYAVWTVGIAVANVNELITNHSLLSWSSISKLVFVTAIAIRMACLPPPLPRRFDSYHPAVDGGNGSDFPGG